jgi:hypothetical protein
MRRHEETRGKRHPPGAVQFAVGGRQKERATGGGERRKREKGGRRRRGGGKVPHVSIHSDDSCATTHTRQHTLYTTRTRYDRANT